MGMRRWMRAAVSAALVVSGPAVADEWVLGLGLDEVRGREARVPTYLLEYRSEPMTGLAGVGFGLGTALEADSDGDVWGGAGAVAYLPLGDGTWRIVGSAMVGGYRQGSTGSDLGRGFPVFRSQIEIDRALGAGWRAGLAFSHKSNAGTGALNPGVETVYLTLGKSF